MFRCTPLSLTLSHGNYPAQFYKEKFHKSHHFDVFNNTPMLAEVNQRSRLEIIYYMKLIEYPSFSGQQNWDRRKFDT